MILAILLTLLGLVGKLDCSKEMNNSVDNRVMYRLMSKKAPGFTLAELLISLAVLGVIATFTIPKVLNGSQNSQYNAMTKEVAAMLVNAQKAYSLENGSLLNTGISDFTPYMNYVSVDTSSIIDEKNGQTTLGCTATLPCLVLHNGGKMRFHLASGVKFTSVASNQAVHVHFDPDGVYGGSTTGPSKSVNLVLYANGRIVTLEDLIPNTYVGGTGPIASIPNTDPEWFSW